MSASLDQDRHVSDSPLGYRSQHTISAYMRGVGVWLLVAAAASYPGTWAQSSGSGRPAPERRPFAKTGTPRRTERIRFFDVKHIKAELLIDTKKRELRGTVTHSVSPLHPYLKQLELDCGPLLKVSRVTVGPKGNSCTFTTKDSKLSVTLDKAYGLGDTLDLAIEYSGSPDRGLYFVWPEAPYPEKRLSFWTQGEAEDTHHWLPCYDYPNERATSEMIITTEKPLFVLSNGTLIETKENDGNTTTYHWKMTVPHSSYLISLAASDFAVYHDRAGDLPVDYYVAKHVDEATARRFMGNTPRMIRFFGDKLGQPYPYPKYAQVCVPDFIAGGMENISATTMTDSALHDEIAEREHQEDGLVAHELAHQWFGDFLTCKDWSHLWLNEGFASYFDPLYAQHDLGDDVFRLEMKGSQDGYIGGDLEYRRPIVESRYEESDDMFDGVTYSKGACVLHALRGLVGDDAWWRGIKAYVAAHKLDVVETDDLRTAMETAYGKDLKWFFDQWVYKAGHPELKVRWHYEDADKTVRVRIQQVQTLDDQTPLFRLPTTLEITEDIGKTRTIPVVIDGASHEFVIPAAARPKMVQIDPLGWLIKELDFEKDVEENLFQLEHAACILGRLDAARALVKAAKDNPKAAKALAAAWSREKAGAASVRWSRSSVTATRSSGPRFWMRPRPRMHAPAYRRSVALPSSAVTMPPRPCSARRGAIPKKPTAHAKPRCVGWRPGKSKTPTGCSPTGWQIASITTRSLPRLSKFCCRRPEPKRASWPRFTASTVNPTSCDLRPSTRFHVSPRTTRLSRTCWWTWPTIATGSYVFGPGTRSRSCAFARRFRSSRLDSPKTGAISGAPCGAFSKTLSVCSRNTRPRQRTRADRPPNRPRPSPTSRARPPISSSRARSCEPRSPLSSPRPGSIVREPAARRQPRR